MTDMSQGLHLCLADERCHSRRLGRACQRAAGHDDDHWCEDAGVRWQWAGELNLEVELALSLYVEGYKAGATSAPHRPTAPEYWREGFIDGMTAAASAALAYRKKLEG